MIAERERDREREGGREGRGRGEGVVSYGNTCVETPLLE
jgi:hypothetical protein